MPDGIPGGIPAQQRSKITLEAMKEVGKERAEEILFEQKESLESIQFAQMRTVYKGKTEKKEKSLKERSKTVTKLMEMKKEKRLLPVEMIKDQAEKYQGKNPELKANVLTLLRERIKPDDTKEEILAKLHEFYADATLADEVLDFLLDTTEGALHQTVKEAKEDFSEEKQREIVAGRNVSTQARVAADKGLGTPTTLRDMYRDITGNPRDSTTLFEELSQKYAYKELQKVIDFLLHSLGSDLKAKGPSIPRGELYRLVTETRSLQAILGVYRFFRGRMGLVESLFSKVKLSVPDQLTFETMAKQFINLVNERYISSDKVLQSAKRLGIEDWVIAKIIAFSQFRDSIRQLAMSQIYKSLHHRDELYLAILDALEELEDQLEELEEKEEEEEEEAEEAEEEER